MPDNNNPRVALVAALLTIGFVVLVALMPGLNTNPFIQGATGLIIMTGIAVVLFSAVPSSAVVKVPLALGGAAAFFFFLLEPVEHYIFPKHTLTGTIYYQQSTTPVPNVAVRDPDTKQEVLTDARGDFTLPNVTWSVTALTATSGGEDYQLVLNKEKKYPVIKRLTTPARTAAQPVAAGEWQAQAQSGCPSAGAGSVRLYLLQKTIPKIAGYPKFYVQVSAPPETEISHAEKLEPAHGVGGEVFDSGTQDPGGDKRTHKWWLPVNDNQVNLKLAVCLNEQNGVLGAPNFTTTYWFEKEVEVQ